MAANPKLSLDQRYRDWEHPLKIEQHKAYALDTDKSYTEYLSIENTEENATD
jgi:hypothetical protein